MLLRQTLLFLPAQIFGPLSQMIAAIVWTYWLSPEDLGTYAIVWSIQELAGLAALYWWSSFVLRYATALAGERARLDASDFAVQSAAALVQSALALGALALVLGRAPGWNLAAATLAFTLTRNVTSHFADRARARFETIPYTLLQAVGSLLGLAIGLAAVATLAPTAEALLWSYTLAQLAGLAVALPLMRLAWARPHLDAAHLRAAWRYGAPLLVASVLAWVGSHAIRFVVEAEAGMEAVGYLTVGWWLGLRLTMFASLLVTGAAFSVAVERIREVGHRAALPQFATNGALLLGILVPSVAGVWLLGRSLATGLVAAAYVPATIEILPWAVAAGAIRAFKNHGTDQCFLLFERTTLNIWSTAFEAVATVLCCWIGLRLGGITGAAAGCAVAAVLCTALSFTVANRLFGYHLRLGDLARIAAATTAMALILAVLPAPQGLTGLLAEIAVGALTYGLAIAALFPAPARLLLGKLSRSATA
ncbi:MAG: polysaccharide biosynthesis C-terminal domain-containing protein [Alphaproteobacteria bacterium]|nr:polysaccharide biosynthesis C-terminal domain-containing protein [Alphaproteobacteria bacterium]